MKATVTTETVERTITEEKKVVNLSIPIEDLKFLLAISRLNVTIPCNIGNVTPSTDRREMYQFLARLEEVTKEVYRG